MSVIVKKIFVSLFVAMFAILSIFFVGCSNEKNIEGKYFFVQGSGQTDNGPMTYMDEKSEDTGLYKYINGGVMNMSEFWIELKNGKMTVNGSITHVAAPDTAGFVHFNVNQQTKREHNYTLKTSKTNEAWYEIWINGEWSLYSVSKHNGGIIFEYESDSINIRYSYDKK